MDHFLRVEAQQVIEVKEEVNLGLVSAVEAKVDNLIVQLSRPIHSSSGEVGTLSEVLQNSPGVTGVLVSLNNGMTGRRLDHGLEDDIEPGLFPCELFVISM